MKIAVIRIRGLVNIKKSFKDTFNMLHLHKKNYCAVYDKRPEVMGMIKKVKDFVTYGEIEEKLFGELIEKRGEEYTGPTSEGKSGKYFEHNGKKYRKFFRLNSPKKGYGRKGVKKSFTQSGALGYRKERINDLIRRMI